MMPLFFSTTEFSSHAKSDEIISLVKQFKNLRAVIINHGEEDDKEHMAKKIMDEIDISHVGIIDRKYFFRIDTWGINKTLSVEFKWFSYWDASNEASFSIDFY